MASDKDYEKYLIEKILSGNNKIDPMMGVSSTQWCKEYTNDGIHLINYFNKFNKILKVHGHNCASLYKECGCACENVKIIWCGNYNKCLGRNTNDFFFF